MYIFVYIEISALIQPPHRNKQLAPRSETYTYTGTQNALAGDVDYY